MKNLITVLLLILLASCQNYQDLLKKYSSYFVTEENKNSKFIDGTDIPLFPDFTAKQDDEMNFDSSSGSISSFKYQSSSNITKISDFYIKNMPQLGWTLNKMTSGKMVFIRQKENLVINFNQISNSEVEINFFLSSVF